MIDVGLYEPDGVTLVSMLTATDVQVGVDGERSVRRTASFTVPASELPALRVYGRMIRMTERVTGAPLFVGYYDDVVAAAGLDEVDVRVSCRDKSKRLKEAAFAQDVTFVSDGGATVRNINTITATSELAVGHEMQQYADVYEQVVTVYDLGVARRLDDAVISGDIREGDLAITASGAKVQRVVLDAYLDLKATEDLQQILLSHTGYADMIEVSTDTVAWVPYVTGPTNCRYIHVQVTGSLAFSAGVRIYAGAGYPASNIKTDDDTSWRPSFSDLEREITLDLGGSYPINALNLRWGLNDAERRTLVTYELWAQEQGVWRDLGIWRSNAGLSELVFDMVTARYLRLRILRTHVGRPALRFAQAQYCTSTLTADAIIKSIAEAEGEAGFDLAPTRRRVEVTFEAGQKKWDALQQLVAESLGDMELYYSADGVLTLRPVTLRTDAPKQVAALLPPFTLTYSDADIRNEIIAVYEGQDITLRHVARNDNAASGSSVPRIGRRSEVVRAPLADTEQKLAVFARRELARRGKATVLATATIAAAAGIEPGDVWRVVESKTGTDSLFALAGYSIAANMGRAEYDLRARLEAV